MLIKRRDFLKTASLATASLWVPRFLQAHSRPGALAHNGRILVMIQLSGGNDGLNTVVPYQNDIYYKERPRLGILKKDALPLTDEAGLHPELQALKSLYDAGDLAVLHNVGYPNPDRSHFRSMDIWHTASPAEEYWSTGWLGRYLDAQCSGGGREVCPATVLEIDDTLSLALKGYQQKGLALQNPGQLYQTARSPYFTDYLAAQNNMQQEDSPVGYLYKTMAETLSSADYLFEKSRLKPSAGTYPDTGMGKHLKTVASLILGGSETSVYYLSLGSFDTHINQAGQQKRLFKELSDALAAFSAELKAQGRWNDVLVATFSEFGRRVAQNASGGTDHGTANQMFFMGGQLKQKGLLNALPTLTDLDEGDLKFNVDFRQVYATLLERWLGTDAEPILGKRFEPLEFV
ncbi:MAG: DUF1501 domain-containing protein [Lewinellaceae bacterium]|nr:DUF1501 domain-containing protein [Lewinellaceae bacterium]MCB9332475.1 DUF1501 domain-containing protein [Lewinellaceae bacterium]